MASACWDRFQLPVTLARTIMYKMDEQTVENNIFTVRGKTHYSIEQADSSDKISM